MDQDIIDAWSLLETTVRRIAARTPAGLLDQQASAKLDAECQEFADALLTGDLATIAGEAADVAYYAVKVYAASMTLANQFNARIVIRDVCARTGLTPVMLVGVLTAKYETRFAYGKDHGMEHAAISAYLEDCDVTLLA